jgi:hypothetical protein
MSQEINRQALVHQIEMAFSDSQYPGDDNLVKKPEHWESVKIPKILTGKNWKAVSPEEIFELRFNLSHFTPEAFCFYLPAYIISSLNKDYGGDIIEGVIFSLDPQEEQGDKRNEFLSKVEKLSTEQKAAVSAFVKFFSETETHLVSSDLRTQQFWEQYAV